MFLSTKEEGHVLTVEKAIKFYEANLGKKRGEIDFEELRYEVGDDRLADGLAYALRRFYIFSSKPQEMNVKSTPLELRLKLFKLVGSTKEGFCKAREAMLQTFIKTYRKELGSLSVEELDDYLWSDDPKDYTLTRLRSPTAQEVIRSYNFEVLDTILSNSKLVSFETKGDAKMPKGTFVKKLVRRVKELGLLYDAYLKDGVAGVSVYGPIELFGRATRFAWRLSLLFHDALPMLRNSSEWCVKVAVQLRRDLTYILTEGSLPELEADVKPEDETIPMFDSKVEARFYLAMDGVSGYTIEREAEPIVVKDTLVVPDYVFRRDDGTKWYLEIVGFWRPEYTVKKKAKLEEIKRAGFKRLILLVDEEYIKYFKDIGFPTFSYKLKGGRLEAPYGSIVRQILSKP